jgi:hypothetical protein
MPRRSLSPRRHHRISVTSLDRMIPTSIGPSTLEAAASMLERGHGVSSSTGLQRTGATGLQRMDAMSLAEGRALRSHSKRSHSKRRHAKRHSSTVHHRR